MTNINPTSSSHVDWNLLPQPTDDGRADHLIGTKVPNILLSATNGTLVTLASLLGISVVFAYPMTGRPDVAQPDNWDMIPGARGCTPQACGFRDLQDDLKNVGVDRVFGLSRQDTDYQREAAERLHLPFPLLSDSAGELTEAISLPTIEVESMVLLNRLTMIIRDGVIVQVFYPVFPPDQSAAQVIEWMEQNGT